MDALEPLITALHTEDRLRVWSLVVTVFGDAVQHRGGRIATLRLQHLLERVGVEAGALRTALSRLTSDGWVVRDREGRNSFYRLSVDAQAEISTASVDIYAAPSSGKVSEWVMASGATAPHKGTEVAANLWLIPAYLAVDMPDHICLTGALASFPEGFAKHVLSNAHQSALIALHNDIAALKGADLTPLDAMAARMLLIHRWRRIVLRFPDVPPELIPAGFALPNPREMVANTYGALVETSEAWLDSSMHGLAPMPACNGALAHRFI
jgi:phenylacetic acid degradation operon negative regulatory protein